MNNKTRKLKYGAFSTATMVFVLACLVVVNMILTSLNINIDLTPDRFYTISQKSEEILSGLEEEVTIYALFQTGSEISMYQQFLNEYDKYPNVKVVEMDFYQNGPFIQSYAAEGETILLNSMIIESGKRAKVVQANELYTSSIDYYSAGETVSTVDFEPQITNAIKYVTAEKVYNVYTLTGHGENPLSDQYKKYVGAAGFSLKELNLYTKGVMPEDCTILLVTTPQVDITSQEAEILKDYLEKGGRAVFFIDYAVVEFANLKGILQSYGIDYEENAALESDTNYIIPVNGGINPFYVVPVLNRHSITAETLNAGKVALMPEPRPLYSDDYRRSSIEIETIMTTSAGAYMKSSWENYTTINPEPGDTLGPFDLAYAVTENFSGHAKGAVTKFIVAGSSALVRDEYNNGTNSSLFINMLNWLSDEKETVYIEGKKITNSDLTFSNYNEMLIICGVSFIALPGIVLIAGISVYIRRRNK